MLCCFVGYFICSYGCSAEERKTVRAVSIADCKNDPAPEPKIYRSVEKNSYKASVKTVSEWDGHANIEISFTNTGKDTIHDWYFTLDYDYVIENHSKNDKVINLKTCLADELLKKGNIQKVFAWTDQSGFSWGGSISFLGKYIEIHFNNGKIENRVVKTNDYFLGIWPRYAPLQY